MATTWSGRQTDRGDGRHTIGGQTTGRGDFASGVNVSDGERVASAIAGGVLVMYGVVRGGAPGWAVAGLGAALAWRGISGQSYVYRALGINRAAEGGTTLEGNLGVKVDRSIVVEGPPEKIYAVWRNLEHLPRVMSHLDTVHVIDRTHSRWSVKAPAGIAITWDAEIINEIPNQLIAWRSLGSSVVRHAGSVHFERAPDGRSTIVRVSLQYDPPGGESSSDDRPLRTRSSPRTELGHAVLGLLGQDADGRIERDLIAFKRAIEAGELAA